MKILHLSTYDHGGAANAAFRLHQGLRTMGIDSWFGSKIGHHCPEDNKIIAATGWRKFYARQAPRIEFHYAKWRWPQVRPVLTVDRFPGSSRSLIKKLKPSIVHLHWVSHNFVVNSDLKWLVENEIPIVWTLHDMAPITGGFGYREAVNLPPSPLGSLVCQDARKTLSQRLIEERNSAIEKAKIAVVAPSKWLANEAKISPIFRYHSIQNIPYGINTDQFSPIDKIKSRQRWNIPRDAKVILFGADTFEDPRKGIQHLISALKIVQKNTSNLLLVGFGNHSPLNISDFPLPVMGLGRLTSADDLCAAYNAADVFVCPSREDNLPNTMIESLSCGVPVVGFEVGGLKDFVINAQTGRLAPCYDETELGSALTSQLSLTRQEQQQMKDNCRDLILSKCTLTAQASAYENLYRSIINP